MHFTTAFLTTLLSAATAFGLVQDDNNYAKHIAPAQYARIASYRPLADTDPKRAVLDLADAMIASMDVSSIPQLRADCAAAFGSEDICGAILAGKDPVSVAARSPVVVDKRGRPQCECTDRDAYCGGGGWYCAYKSNDCVFNNGCGTLGLYRCNGLCEKH